MMTPTMSIVLFKKLSACDRAVQPVKTAESDMVNSGVFWCFVAEVRSKGTRYALGGFRVTTSCACLGGAGTAQPFLIQNLIAITPRNVDSPRFPPQPSLCVPV